MSSLQNESHDWLADAAESLVRYYFAKEGFYAYGAGKWGSDCAFQNQKTGRLMTAEVKSADGDKSSIQNFKKQIKKFDVRNHPLSKPDIYAEVRLKKVEKENIIKITLWKIDKENNCVDRSFRSLQLGDGGIRKWIKECFLDR